MLSFADMATALLAIPGGLIIDGAHAEKSYCWDGPLMNLFPESPLKVCIVWSPVEIYDISLSQSVVARHGFPCPTRDVCCSTVILPFLDLRTLSVSWHILPVG